MGTLVHYEQAARLKYRVREGPAERGLTESTPPCNPPSAVWAVCLDCLVALSGGSLPSVNAARLFLAMSAVGQGRNSVI